MSGAFRNTWFRSQQNRRSRALGGHSKKGVYHSNGSSDKGITPLKRKTRATGNNMGEGFFEWIRLILYQKIDPKIEVRRMKGKTV